jgi:transposase
MQIKSQKTGLINEKTLIVSLDIGKRIHYGYMRAPNGKDIAPYAVCNSKKSFEQFWMKIVHFKRQQGLEEVVIGFESSGPYAEPLCHYLKDKPAKLVQVNPMHTKRIKELTGNSPNKTDKKDPRVIADVMSLGHALTVVIPEGAAAQLRRLTQARERNLSSRTAMINQLHHLVFTIFPEFCDVINISTKTGMYLIKNHATPETIYAMGVNKVAAVVKRVSRGKLDQERAKKLVEAAGNSIGICEGKESILFEIAHLVWQIESQNRFVDMLEKQMATWLNQVPYSGSILSIKGIGVPTAAGLIGEAGDFRKFRTISQIMKLAGLDLYEVSSGQHKGQRHISKRGRSLMRKLLFFAAINAVKSNGIMHEPYQRMLDRGMPKVMALTAISRKLLKIIFALARDNAEYDRHHDQINRYKLAA